MPINDAPSLLGAGSQGTTSLLNGGERRFPFIKRLVPLCEQVVGISIDETRTHVRPGTSPSSAAAMPQLAGRPIVPMRSRGAAH
jgi:hypothetical protein